jgi:hypothetical protein
MRYAVLRVKDQFAEDVRACSWPGEAERQGKGKTVSRDRAQRRWLRPTAGSQDSRAWPKKVLRPFGAVDGGGRNACLLGLPEALILRQSESDALASAPEPGILELLVNPGDVVIAGQPTTRASAAGLETNRRPRRLGGAAVSERPRCLDRRGWESLIDDQPGS